MERSDQTCSREPIPENRRKPAALVSMFVLAAAILVILWSGGYLGGGKDERAEAVDESPSSLWPPGQPQIESLEWDGVSRRFGSDKRIEISSSEVTLRFVDSVPAIYRVMLNGSPVPLSSDRMTARLVLQPGENRLGIRPSGDEFVIVSSP